MKLRGIEYGNVLTASGIQGFFGEGYPHHKLLKLANLDFSGVTFVSKTTPYYKHAGNGPLWKTIRAKPWRGVMLNAVGLKSPGFVNLLSENRWQKRVNPFMISIAPIADKPGKRIKEIWNFVDSFTYYNYKNWAPFCIQLNISCNHTICDLHQLQNELIIYLEILNYLNVPVMVKLGVATTPINFAMELNDNFYCDAICVSNSIPFGWSGLDWKKVWGSKKSPLAKFGNGSLSGKPLKELTCNWIKELRSAGFTKSINGGGGIATHNDVYDYHNADASSIFIGSMTNFYPWKVQKIVSTANDLIWHK